MEKKYAKYIVRLDLILGYLFICIYFFCRLGFSTFLGMIVLAFASSEIFRIFFRMFLGIVGFGLIHGLCIMPVYMSLLCWKPSVTTSPSVRVSAERLGSIKKKDESSHDLQLVAIGIENPGLAAENPSLELGEEENVD